MQEKKLVIAHNLRLKQSVIKWVHSFYNPGIYRISTRARNMVVALIFFKVIITHVYRIRSKHRLGSTNRLAFN